MTTPNASQALGRKLRGRITPASRPYPERLLCSTAFEVPDRLLRSALPPLAKLLGVELCRTARQGEVAILIDNDTLAASLGVSPRAAQRALIALESAGFVWRLEGHDEVGLTSLELAGYADPWAGVEPRPARVIVLLWRLPDPRSLGQGARNAPRAESLR